MWYFQTQLSVHVKYVESVYYLTTPLLKSMAVLQLFSRSKYVFEL